MKREIRNPKSHRSSEANQLRTLAVLDTYRGKIDLLRQWELQPDKVQIRQHSYILKLRATVRKYKNLLEHRNYDVTI